MSAWGRSEYGRTKPGEANKNAAPGPQWNKPYRKTPKTRSAAIRAHCYECNGVKSFTEYNDCIDESCALYPFRPGEGPGKAPKGKQKPPQKANTDAK